MCIEEKIDARQDGKRCLDTHNTPGGKINDRGRRYHCDGMHLAVHSSSCSRVASILSLTYYLLRRIPRVFRLTKALRLLHEKCVPWFKVQRVPINNALGPLTYSSRLYTPRRRKR